MTAMLSSTERRGVVLKAAPEPAAMAVTAGISEAEERGRQGDPFEMAAELLEELTS